MRLKAGVAVAAVLLGLTGCDSSVDRLRTTICRRALPALVPSEQNPRLLSIGRGSAPDSVRVDYVTGHQQHRIVCAFDQGVSLTGIMIDHRSVTGGAVYMLKRYYLETPDAEAGDPGLARSGN